MKKFTVVIVLCLAASWSMGETLTLTPGIDAYMNLDDDLNYGASTVLKSGSSGDEEAYRALLRFYFPEPNTILNKSIESATLTVPVRSQDGPSDTAYYVVGYVQTWQEGTGVGDTSDGVTASTYDGTNEWTGFFGFADIDGNYDPNAYGAYTNGDTTFGYLDVKRVYGTGMPYRYDTALLANMPYDNENIVGTAVFDVTELVHDWVTGHVPPLGIGIVQDTDGTVVNQSMTFWDREVNDANFVPKLEIVYDPNVTAYKADLRTSKDTMLMIYDPFMNFGDSSNMVVSEREATVGNRDRISLAGWELPGDLDASKFVKEAKIHFYCFSALPNTDNKTYLVEAMTSGWVQGTGVGTSYTYDGAEWVTSDGVDPWPGFDYQTHGINATENVGAAAGWATDNNYGVPITYGQTTFAPIMEGGGLRWFEGGLGGEFEIDVTDLVRKWASGELDNHGVRLSIMYDGDAEIDSITVFTQEAASKKYAPPTGDWAPRLLVEYTDYVPACDDIYHRLEADLDGDCYVNSEDLAILVGDWLRDTSPTLPAPTIYDISSGGESATGWPSNPSWPGDYPHHGYGWWAMHFGRMEYHNEVEFPCGWEKWNLSYEMTRYRITVHEAHLGFNMRNIRGGDSGEPVMSMRVEPLSQAFIGGSGDNAWFPRDGACLDNPIGQANGGDIDANGIDWDGGTKWGLDAIVPGYSANTGLLPVFEHHDPCYLPLDVDVTTMVQAWSDGVMANHGVIMIPECTMEFPVYRGLEFDMDERFSNGRTSEFPTMHVEYSLWQDCDPPLDADFNNDCTVDLIDFSKFQEQWMQNSVLPQ